MWLGYLPACTVSRTGAALGPGLGGANPDLLWEKGINSQKTVKASVLCGCEVPGADEIQIRDPGDALEAVCRICMDRENRGQRVTGRA